MGMLYVARTKRPNSGVGGGGGGGSGGGGHGGGGGSSVVVGGSQTVCMVLVAELIWAPGQVGPGEFITSLNITFLIIKHRLMVYRLTFFK